MPMVLDWWGWGGGAAAAVLSDYADARMRRISASLTNGELVQIAAVLTEAFDLGARWPASLGKLVDGAADYAFGALVSSIVRRQLRPTAAPIPTVAAAPAPAPAAAPPPAPAPAAPSPQSSSPTPIGVPASGGSAAFNLPIPDY